MVVEILAHTGFAPVIVQGGSALTVTVFVQAGLLTQPLALVVVRVKVKVPAAPAVTPTDCEVVEPTIVPLPLIDQV